jgi:hypothetical protein
VSPKWSYKTTTRKEMQRDEENKKFIWEMLSLKLSTMQRVIKWQ